MLKMQIKRKTSGLFSEELFEKNLHVFDKICNKFKGAILPLLLIIINVLFINIHKPRGQLRGEGGLAK